MLTEVTSPVFIVHGQQDELIPFNQAQMLLDHCVKSSYSNLSLPPNMTHNKLNIETDLIKPLNKFLKQIRLDLSATTAPARQEEPHIDQLSRSLVVKQSPNVLNEDQIAVLQHGR